MKRTPLKRKPLRATAKALRAKTYKPLKRKPTMGTSKPSVMRHKFPPRLPKLKRSPIKKITAKQSQKEKYWHILVNFLIKYRAKGICEIKGKDCKRKAVMGHHIKPRNLGRVDTAGNIICSCDGEFCHNHGIFGVGMPISKEEAFRRVIEANKRCGISNNLTGVDIDKSDYSGYNETLTNK